MPTCVKCGVRNNFYEFEEMVEGRDSFLFYSDLAMDVGWVRIIFTHNDTQYAGRTVDDVYWFCPRCKGNRRTQPAVVRQDNGSWTWPYRLQLERDENGELIWRYR